MVAFVDVLIRQLKQEELCFVFRSADLFSTQKSLSCKSMYERITGEFHFSVCRVSIEHSSILFSESSGECTYIDTVCRIASLRLSAFNLAETCQIQLLSGPNISQSIHACCTRADVPKRADFAQWLLVISISAFSLSLTARPLGLLIVSI